MTHTFSTRDRQISELEAAQAPKLQRNPVSEKKKITLFLIVSLSRFCGTKKMELGALAFLKVFSISDYLSQQSLPENVLICFIFVFLDNKNSKRPLEKRSLCTDGFSKLGNNKKTAATTPSKFCTQRHKTVALLQTPVG